MATTEQARTQLERVEAARVAYATEVAAGKPKGALQAVVDYFTAEAAQIRENRKQGWKGKAERLEAVADELARFADPVSPDVSIFGTVTLHTEGSGPSAPMRPEEVRPFIVGGPDIPGSYGPEVRLEPVGGGEVGNSNLMLPVVGPNPFRAPVAVGPDKAGQPDALSDWIGGKTDAYPEGQTAGDRVAQLIGEHAPSEAEAAVAAFDGRSPEDDNWINDEPHPVSLKPPGATLTLFEYGPSTSPLPAVEGQMQIFRPPARTTRLSWADFALVAASFQVESDKRVSYSTIDSLGQCSMRWALDHATAEVPTWATVAGKAWHRVAEAVAKDEVHPNTDDNLAAGWERAFGAEIMSAEAASQLASDEWHVSGKGLETREWWRVEGLAMLQRYRDYCSREQRVEGHATAVWATEVDLDVTVAEDLRIQVIIDQVRFLRGAAGYWWITDYKTGSSKPDDTLQLGLAAWALKQFCEREGKPFVRASGGFYLAREGSHDLETLDLIAAHPWEEVAYLATAAQAQIRAGAFLPRPTVKGYGGCPSCGQRDLCPASTTA